MVTLSTSCLLALSMLGASPDGVDAEKVLREYLLEVQDAIGADPAALGTQNSVLLKLDEIGRKHFEPHKGLLHQRAAEDYGNLPQLPVDLLSGNVSLREGREEEFAAIESLFHDDSVGKAPFDHHVIISQWWNPLYAAKTLRDVVADDLLRRDQKQRRRFVEQFVAPRLYRLSGNAEQPELVFFGGRELFIVRLAYLESGIYCLKSLDWQQVPRRD
ncbi:MAG: hypothetical protein RIS70_2049 [Planctomycetota bacterium]